MFSLTNLLIEALGVYKFILIASVVLFWLIKYKIVDFRTDVVKSVWTFLAKVTEPVLAPIRRMLPDMGGIDLSPLIVILAIHLLQNMLAHGLLL